MTNDTWLIDGEDIDSILATGASCNGLEVIDRHNFKVILPIIAGQRAPMDQLVPSLNKVNIEDEVLISNPAQTSHSLLCLDNPWVIAPGIMFSGLNMNQLIFFVGTNKMNSVGEPEGNGVN